VNKDIGRSCKIVCVLGYKDSERLCIIVCDLGVQRLRAIIYNSMFFRGTKIESGHV
jgi:hypothetical protein